MNFLYTRPTDRHLGTVTVNAGAEDPDYPKENLDDDRPERPAKLTTTTGAWQRDLGIAQSVGIVGIINHNFDSGLAVTLEGNATNDWTSPSYAYRFAVPARRLDLFTSNLWVVVKKAYRFWRLSITGKANSAPLSVGEWLMYHTVRDLGIRNIKWGSERTWRKPAIIHETEMAVRRAYTIGTFLRELSVDVEPTDVNVRNIEDWWRSADGNVRPFLIVPNKDEANAEGWMVTFIESNQPYKRERRNYNTATMTFRELSPGLYP